MIVNPEQSTTQTEVEPRKETAYVQVVRELDRVVRTLFGDFSQLKQVQDARKWIEVIQLTTSFVTLFRSITSAMHDYVSDAITLPAYEKKVKALNGQLSLFKEWLNKYKANHPELNVSQLEQFSPDAFLPQWNNDPDMFTFSDGEFLNTYFHDVANVFISLQAKIERYLESREELLPERDDRHTFLDSVQDDLTNAIYIFKGFNLAEGAIESQTTKLGDFLNRLQALAKKRERQQMFDLLKVHFSIHGLESLSSQDRQQAVVDVGLATFQRVLANLFQNTRRAAGLEGRIEESELPRDEDNFPVWPQALMEIEVFIEPQQIRILIHDDGPGFILNEDEQAEDLTSSTHKKYQFREFHPRKGRTQYQHSDEGTGVALADLQAFFTQIGGSFRMGIPAQPFFADSSNPGALSEIIIPVYKPEG